MLVIIDKEIKDKYRNQYLNLIKKEIENVKVVDFRESATLKNYRSILVLEPINDKFKMEMKEFFMIYPEKDIEGSYTKKLTITAESVLSVLPINLKSKTIMIINQSEILGKPLAKELINRGANVISLNSKCDIIYELLKTRPDILISATGNKNFKIKEEHIKFISMKIDLSNDLITKEKITSIPTIKILNKRYQKVIKNNKKLCTS
ncbi:MAG: hypothetical protein PUG84_01530 [Peptoniphilaceae bacterium]|nr:hypothetical protein [Peptoniphilaceae bacterium]